MKTAMQDLVEKLVVLSNSTFFNGKKSDCDIIDKIKDIVRNEFLEKEKKQIIESCEWGLNDACEQSEKGGFVKISKGEEYYAETYGSTP